MPLLFFNGDRIIRVTEYLTIKLYFQAESVFVRVKNLLANELNFVFPE